MTDPVIPHHEEQRSFSELREQFRAENQQRLRDSFAGQHPLGWNMIGDSSHARDCYSAEEWSFEMLHHLDSPTKQDFGLGSVPAHLGGVLEDLAQKSFLHDSVTWDSSVEGVVDHDAPACTDITKMTEDEQLAYMDSVIKEGEQDE